MIPMSLQIRFAALTLTGLIASALTAQTPVRGSSVRPPAAFGTTEYSVTSVSAASFTSADTHNDRITLGGNFYRYFDAGSLTFLFLGSVSIPEGVIIDYVGLNNCDPVAGGGSFTFKLMDFTTDGSFTNVFTLNSNHNTCIVDYNSAAGAINYSYPQNAGHNLQIFVYQNLGTPTDGSAAVQSVEVWWRRQVSPAPGTSDFGDVPTSSPQFQFVEALYHAGITAGCGGGNYCPDNPVTRGQMAVFLAKALGLYWPETPVP
jgi:hypothetical protein